MGLFRLLRNWVMRGESKYCGYGNHKWNKSFNSAIECKDLLRHYHIPNIGVVCIKCGTTPNIEIVHDWVRLDIGNDTGLERFLRYERICKSCGKQQLERSESRINRTWERVEDKRQRERIEHQLLEECQK